MHEFRYVGGFAPPEVTGVRLRYGVNFPLPQHELTS